jgi:uncharacterized membrane protein (DUF373 family)
MTNSHPEQNRSLVVHYLSLAERLVLIVIAIVLVALAVLLLGSHVISLVQAVMDGTIKEAAIDILDGVLLVMMTMEIVYTVTLSLQSHKLIAEPFLIIGIIAAIRRILVITAESTRLEDNPALFQSTLLELALLALIVGILAFSISMMRKTESLASPDQTKLDD